MVAQLPINSLQPTVTWEALPDDYVLPDDPVENIQQPWLAAALTDALDTAGRLTPAMLVGSNFGLVATVNNKIAVKAPDWFYIPRVDSPSENIIRRSYTPNLQGDPVAIVMEFLSDTDNNELSLRPMPPYGKLYFYEKILQVPTYCIYDPYTMLLEVRRLQNGVYQIQLPNPQGCYWIPELELFLGVWQGERLGQQQPWLRWWDADGNLLLWGSERAQQTQQQLELEQQRADQEQQRANEEQQRADQEQQRANEEQQKALRLAAKLRELGVDPEQLL